MRTADENHNRNFCPPRGSGRAANIRDESLAGEVDKEEEGGNSAGRKDSCRGDQCGFVRKLIIN